MTPPKRLKKIQLTGLAVLLVSSLILASCAKPPEPLSSNADTVIEVPAESPPIASSPTETPANTPAEPTEANIELPPAVETAIFQDIASSQNVPIESLKVTDAQSQSWPDGCLGLGGPDEICTFALVDGWEVTVSQADNQWVYRSDREGLVVRLADSPIE